MNCYLKKEENTMGEICNRYYSDTRINDDGEVEYYINDFGVWLTEDMVQQYNFDDEILFNEQHGNNDDD
jgi:hypothetical protein